jgi:hypothetical protein
MPIGETGVGGAIHDAEVGSKSSSQINASTSAAIRDGLVFGRREAACSPTTPSRSNFSRQV